jgi:hypothetical protein
MVAMAREDADERGQHDPKEDEKRHRVASLDDDAPLLLCRPSSSAADPGRRANQLPASSSGVERRARKTPDSGVGEGG